MKNVSQKHSQRFTKATAQACLLGSCLFLSVTASAQWSTTTSPSVNLPATATGYLKVTKDNEGVSNLETLLDARMNESPNDFFKIMNATFVDNRFIPTLLGYSGSDTRGVFRLIGGIPATMDNAAYSAVMNFDSRIWNTGDVKHRPLFSWSSFNIDRMGMAANGDLSVGTGATPNGVRLFVTKPANPIIKLQETSIVNGPSVEIAIASSATAFAKTSQFGDAVIRQIAGSPAAHGDLILNIPADNTAAPLTRAVRIADNVNDIFSVFNAGNLGSGRVAIGSGFTPSEQLHTTAGVRFQGLTSAPSPLPLVLIDGTGKLYRSTLSTANLATTNCITTNFVPRVSNATGLLSCGVIQDNATEVGIGGVPVTGIRLTVYGNAHFLSDKNYKKNVAPLNNALAKVKQLKGWYYDWDTQKHPDMGLSDTRQLGFMAQDVGKILPEAVSTSPEGTVLMNYNALIPVLTEAIKEQDATIEAQKTTIESLEERVNRLETALEQLLGQEPKNLKTGFKLEQNTPNPFSDKTVLAYEMPKNMGSAQIIITDLAGRLLKTIQLKDCCGTVEISAQDFVNGTFIYSLVANGKVLKTNKMVVAKN